MEQSERSEGAPARRRGARWVMAVAAASLVVGVAVVSGASPAGATPVNCQVDPTTNIPAQYPDARQYADVLRNGGCQIIWDNVVSRLVGASYTPPSGFRVIWEPSGVAWTVNGEVHIGYTYLQDRWNQYGKLDWGLAYHEFAHVAQSYPGGANAQWVTEGLADWVRYDQGQPPLDHPAPKPGCSGHHYTEGYECGAAFLGWIDRHYRGGDHSVILMLNGAYHYGSGNSPATNLQILTGQTIDQLWWNCLYEDCAGGLLGP